MTSAIDHGGAERHGRARQFPTHHNSGAGVASTDPFMGTASEPGTDFVQLSRATTALSARQVALVPGADVAVLTLDLPKGLRGQSREQVARRQLRDRIGMDADTVEMRPFHAAREADKWTRILVADTARVEAWRAAAGEGCRAVLPDYLALPTAEGVWTVAQSDSGIALRLGPVDGFGAADTLAPKLFSRALAEANTPPKALLRLGAPLAEIEAIAAAHDIPILTDAAQAKAQVLAHGELAFDLRRDPQQARARLARRVLPWRWPVLLGAIAAALWGGGQVVVTNRIEAETAQLRLQTSALVQEHFVKTGPVLDARVQVSQALARSQADAAGGNERADPLALFARAASVIAAEKAQTQMATYTADGLSLVVRVTDFAAADRLAAALRAAGLLVEVSDTRVSDSSSGVRSAMRITQDPKAQAQP
jgi:general secretion pathway protein L